MILQYVIIAQGRIKIGHYFLPLFIFLCQPSCSLESITLRFNEMGHTSMSADSANHDNENAIRRKWFLYDFQDFVACVNDKGTAIIIDAADFIYYKNEKGIAKDIHPLHF